MFLIGQRCFITGWGTLSSGGSQPNILQEAEVPIVTQQECRKFYGSTITDQMICAGYAAGGIDSCQGDSGGTIKLYSFRKYHGKPDRNEAKFGWYSQSPQQNVSARSNPSGDKFELENDKKQVKDVLKAT